MAFIQRIFLDKTWENFDGGTGDWTALRLFILYPDIPFKIGQHARIAVVIRQIYWALIPRMRGYIPDASK